MRQRNKHPNTSTWRLLPQFQPLEPRLLLSGSASAGAIFSADAFPLPKGAAVVTQVVKSAAGAALPLGALPALNSLAGAAAQLYLDFNGDTTSTWGRYRPGATPAFDQDGDPTTFSTGELAAINEIWTRVAEKFSPFNINVTTVDPGNLADRKTLRVVIGGRGDWLDGGRAGGVGYTGGFYNSAPNTVFVFSRNLSNGNPKYTAEVAAHEAGHGFGLKHQALWSGTRLIDEYNSGNSQRAPIMGISYDAARGLWQSGPTDESRTRIQNDLAVLAGAFNGFGYRTDDHGNSIASPTGLTVTGTAVAGAGVIEKTSDLDFFSFTTGAGNVTLTAAVASKGAMLDLKLEVRGMDGSLKGLVDTAALGEKFSAYLPAGTYYVVVASHGGYGDVGQYTISGKIVASDGAGASAFTSTVSSPAVPAQRLPNAPASLSAIADGQGRIRLNWKDNSSNESGFRIERSSNGVTWKLLGNVPAGTERAWNTGLTASATYFYRVAAYNASGRSSYTNVATARAAVEIELVRTLRPAALGRFGLFATRPISNSFGGALFDNAIRTGFFARA